MDTVARNFWHNEHRIIWFLLQTSNNCIIRNNHQKFEKIERQVLFLRNHLNTRLRMYKAMLLKFTCHLWKVSIILVFQMDFSPALSIL